MKEQIPSFLTSFNKGIVIPILLFVAFAPFADALDLKMSRAFYENGAFSSNPLWNWMFNYGFWPAWIAVIIALGGIVLSFFSIRYRQWRNPCLVIVLTFAIGSGLLVHAGFKDNWGRPRPKQTVEFGGKQLFHPFYQPQFTAQPEPSKSFTCGHCSAGFTFFSLALLGSYYRTRLLWWLGWGLAWGLGLLLSATRIAQGGHFLSDTFGSALIMWLTAWTLTYLLIVRKGKKNERTHP